jgi:UDP-GlcNAc:undecaprenyl-phosphate/decaprenyl-phosphate GlcNAc-1-phosphate transferase
MYDIDSLIIGFFAAFFSCVVVTHLLLQSRVSQLALDQPNRRSLHVLPVPRIGGLSITLSVAAGVASQLYVTQIPASTLERTIPVYLLLLATSLVDDIRPFSAKLRLSIHLAVVTFWVIGQNTGSLLLATVFILGITWAMNLYNFMDGSDGLAGSITFTSFLAYFVAAIVFNDKSMAILCIAVCGATLGFLKFNWPPARLFLGDSGSIPLGFLAAAIGTIGVLNSYWGPQFPLMLFAMFWIDATYTLARRAFRGEKVWQAHNEHWYQKAIRAGNSHRKVLLIHLTCNIVIAGLALLSTLSPTFATPLVHILTIGVVIAIAFGFGVWAESQFRGFQAKQIK